MQNKNNTTIENILVNFSEINTVIYDYCDNNLCLKCELNSKLASCDYVKKLIMFLIGYRMGICDPAERQQIDNYMSENFQAITKILQNINP